MIDDALCCKPKLTPDQPPKWYPHINKCRNCDADYGVKSDGLFHTSCVLTQDNEGWFKVICANCNNEGIAAASGETAVRLWNEVNNDW